MQVSEADGLSDRSASAGVELSRHLRSRTAVGEILMESGIETIVLQAGIVVGSGSASFEMIRHLTDRLPAMTTPRWVHNKIQPIAISVMHYLVAAARAGCRSRAPGISADPTSWSTAKRCSCTPSRRVATAADCGAAVPDPDHRELVGGLVTPIPSGLARPLVESLEFDAVMAEHDIDTVIPPPSQGLSGYRESVAEALQSDGLLNDRPARLAQMSPTAPQ